MARYGQFEAYEPAPDVAPDAFRFKLGNGNPILLSGQPALELKGRLDAYDQAQPRTAKLDGAGGTMSKLDAIGGYGAADAPPTPEQIQGFREQIQAPAAGGPPPSIARAPGGDTPQQGPGGGLGYGLTVSPQGEILERKYVPGTAARTKEMIAAEDANATAVRRGETTQIQEGTPQSQEYLDTRSALRGAEYEALQKQQADEQAALDEQSRLAAEQEKAQLRLATEANSRAAELDTKFKHEEELRNKAVAEYSNSSVNPNRIFSNPAVGVLGALAAGAGAYAAVIGKTPNFAAQAIESAVERDIRAQEAQIRIKGETKDTLIGQLRDTGLSRDQAHAAAKQIMYQHHIAQNEAAKLKHAGTALENKFTNIGLGLQQAWNDADEQGRQAGRDKVVRSVQSGFEHERAGTAGGYVVRPVADQLGTAQKVQNLRKGEAELAKDAAALTKGPAASPETRQAAGAVAEVGVLKDLASKYGPNEGLPSYEARTIFGQAWETFADKIAGQGAGISSETAVARQDLARIQAGLSSANSVLGGQGSMTGDEQKVFAAGMAPGATWGDVQRAVRMTSDRAKARGQAAQQVGEAGGSVVTK